MSGTGAGLAFAALAVAGCGLLAHATRQPPTAASTDRDGAQSAQGAQLMGQQIVPVWRRHLTASRDEADRGVNGLLQHFSSLSDGLNDAIAAAEGNQAMRITAVSSDELIERHPLALKALIEPLQHLRAQRRDMAQLLREVEAGQDRIQRVSQDVTRLSRHISLVAMNAAIEANRGGSSHGGFNSVAAEVREIASGLSECSRALDNDLKDITGRVRNMRSDTELADESDETLEIASRVRAHEVVELLVKDLGTALEQSRRLRETSQRLRDDLDGVFVGFQFQDRLNQMLGSLHDDMERFHQWLQQPGQAATSQDAAEWLRRLETTYTMQEQHAFHHGNAEIRKAAEVEFF